MRNYKILVIVLLTISITMTISISYAQISEQIPSPKQQIDNGVAPHDVVCRDDLILVDHGMNNITCVKKTTAQKMNWEIIDNKLDEKSNIVKNNEMDVVFETITSTHNSNGHGIGSSYLPPMASFTFPRNVTVGETFFINYTIDWVDENGTLLYPTLYSDGSNIEFYPFILASNEFSVLNNSFNLVRVMADKNASHMLAFYTGNPISFSNETITDSIEVQLTENMLYTLDTMYIFAGKFLQLQLFDNNNSIGLISRSELGEDKFYSHFDNIDANRYRISILFDNDTQKWYKGNNIELETLPNGFPNYIPETANLPSQNKVNTISEPQNNTLDQKPSCIIKLQWQAISENERYAILNNHTTCQLLNGDYITNLPPIGYQLFPKYAFEGIPTFIDITYDSFESFIEDVGITDETWIKDFSSYYYNMTTKSYPHISKQTLSPKQQIDSGVELHNVICRNGLFLVERSTNEIACTHETTAQKMGWRVISQPIPILEETNVSFQDTLNSNKTVKKTLEEPR